ncbi:MAG: type VI secretion system baseplate subunit TssG [Gammaproteobacteria bacterium]
MGTTSRRKLPDIIYDVLGNAPSFEFFQAIRLLEDSWHGHGTVRQGLEKWIRMRPASEMSFPGADIRRCKLGDDNKFDLQLNFMGLYGVDAAVPNYFIEFIARDDESCQPMRKFIDIFCHRLYSQFYLAWKKYRPYTHLEQKDSPYLHYLAALSGNVITDSDSIELGYCGAIGSRVRSATALSGVLSDFMGNVPVEIEQFVARWIKIDEQVGLGANEPDGLCLGDNTILGNEVLDVSGKVDIVIGPMKSNEVNGLLPGNNRARELGSLVDRFMDPTMTFDVLLKVEPSDGIGIYLGAKEVVLGWTTVLGSASNSSYDIRLPGKNFAVKNPNDTKIDSDKLDMVA